MTVSNVMNDRPVSESARAQVLEAIRRLNYQPSAIARALNRKPMDTIGVVLPDASQSPMAHPYFGPVLDGIMGTAVTLHKDVTIYTGSLWNESSEGVRRYRDGRADGLVLITPMVQPELVKGLLEVNVPFVCVGRYRGDDRVSWIGIDEMRCSILVTQYLLQLGHRRIAMFLAEDKIRYFRMRREGYIQALQEWEVEPDEGLIMPGTISHGSVRGRVEMIASYPANKRPTAVIAFNDEMAFMILEELKREKLRVPEDISVVGFDDAAGAEDLGLTTIRQPLRKIGMRAAQLLVEHLRNPQSEPATEVVEAELISRSSTRHI
jgi:DNA-binding LacI/PurR family transcriptional regulator